MSEKQPLWGLCQGKSIRLTKGIVTLIKNGPNLLAVREVKPLKLNIATISEPSRFRCKCD